MILAALFSRPVRKQPVRFVATLLGIAAGVAAVVSTLGASGAALSSLREGVGALSGRAVLEVSCAGGVPETELSRLAPLANDAVLLPVIEEVTTCTTLGDTVRVLGVDFLSDPRFAAGHAELAAAPPTDDALSARVAVVSDALARDAHVKLGDSITLSIATRPVELRIAGTFPAGATAILGRLVVIDIALAQRLFGRAGRLGRIEIVPRGDVSVESLRERARALVSTGMSVSTPGERAAEADTLVRSLEFNLTTMSAISLVVGGVLVATTLATAVVQRRRTIALLYALGASRRQVVHAILFEALVLGLLGGLVGVVLGYLTSRFMVDGMRATLSTLVSTTAASSIPFQLTHAALGLALGCLVSLAAAVLPVFEGARTPPIQALRGETPLFLSPRARGLAFGLALLLAIFAVELMQWPAWRGLPVAALAAAFLFLGAMFALFGPLVDLLGRAAGTARALPPTVRLACAGLSAGRKRAAWAAGAVGVAVALSIAVATMVGSFRTTVVDWVERSINADIAVRPMRGRTGVPIGRLDPEIVAIAQALPGASAAYAYYVAAAHYRGERIGLGGVSFEAARARGWSAMLDKSDSRVAIERAWKNGEVLVSEAGAHRFGWSAGDMLAIDILGRPFSARIAGVYMDHSESQGFVLVDATTYLGYFPDDRPLFIDINCRTRDDIEPTQRALHAALDGRFDVEINDNPTMRAAILSVFDKTFAITHALQGVSAVVAIIAVLSVLFALVSERRADIALLSAIGASSAQVHALVATQAGLLGLVGAGLGSVCGLVIGFVLVAVVNLQSFGWSLQFVRPWWAMVTIVLVVGGACTLAGLLPARAASRSTLRAAIREE